MSASHTSSANNLKPKAHKTKSKLKVHSSRIDNHLQKIKQTAHHHETEPEIEFIPIHHHKPHHHYYSGYGPTNPVVVRSTKSVESVQSEPLDLIQSRYEEENLLEQTLSNLLGSGDASEVKTESFQTLPLLKQRIGGLLRDKIHTDVVFEVGETGEKFEAHSLILASGSPTFEKLFYDSAQSKTLELDEHGKYLIRVPEFLPVPFEVFLMSIYTNEIPTCLSFTMALDVFYASKKYDVKFLLHQILEHITSAITPANVFEALHVGTRVLELTSIIPTCLQIIEEETRQVLEFNLETLDVHSFPKILDRDVLNITEIELFKVLIKWAKLQCKRRELKPIPTNKRKVLEPLLKHIRFTTMDIKTIQEVVEPTRILEQHEITTIMNYVKGSEYHKPLVPYKTVPRRTPSPKSKMKLYRLGSRFGYHKDTIEEELISMKGGGGDESETSVNGPGKNEKKTRHVKKNKSRYPKKVPLTHR